MKDSKIFFRDILIEVRFFKRHYSTKIKEKGIKVNSTSLRILEETKIPLVFKNKIKYAVLYQTSKKLFIHFHLTYRIFSDIFIGYI